ncbi:MAG: DUF5655 domain-containing protein [Chitinophagales bacterium]|nr:DUF5655 domain-containing protein [Chitinophagales bacterium]
MRNPNQWHNCVKVSIDSLFENKAPELLLIFDKLLAEIEAWDEVTVSATKNCIVFVHRQTFLIIRPMKRQLDLKFYSSHALEVEPIQKSLPYNGRYINHLRLSSLEDISPIVFSLLKASYVLL